MATDYANHLYVRAYNTLFSGTGKVFNDQGNALDRTDFSRGYALYAFDLTPDLGEDDHFNLTKQGSVRLVLKFREALAENVTVIAYAVSERDRNRQKSQRDLRLCSMNTYELERVIRQYVNRFAAAIVCYLCVIPIHPICPANTGSPSMWTMMDITENISTRSDVNLLVFLNVT